MRSFAHEPADDALQRAVDHLDHHPFADERAAGHARDRLPRAGGGCRFPSQGSAPISPSKDTILTTPVHVRTGSRPVDRIARNSSRETAASRSSSCDPSSGSTSGWSEGTLQPPCARAVRERPARVAIASRSRTRCGSFIASIRPLRRFAIACSYASSGPRSSTRSGPGCARADRNFLISASCRALADPVGDEVAHGLERVGCGRLQRVQLQDLDNRAASSAAG